MNDFESPKNNEGKCIKKCSITVYWLTKKAGK